MSAIPQRILITSRLAGAGGVETHLLNLCRILVENGAEVTLVTRFANPETPLLQLARGIPVHIMATPFAKNLRWFRLSTAWALAVWPLFLRAQSFDVLYTLELSPLTHFLKRFVKPAGRVILGQIGSLVNEPASIYQSGIPLLDGVIVESQIQADAFRRSVSTSIPIAAIPLLGHFSQPAPRRSRNIDRLRVAYLGRYDRAKGIYRLLDLWPRLDVQPASLDFYGHGSEAHNLKAEISGRGLSQQIQVNSGWTTSAELARILDRTDLLVLPSESEGLPVILLEAMAFGVPFVATDVGAVRSLARNNPDVRVVPLNDLALKNVLEEIARKIRSGEVGGSRLQEYHCRHFSFAHLSSRWVEAMLFPERFWSVTSLCDHAELAQMSSAASNLS